MQTEPSGNVHAGAVGPDAVEVTMRDDEFAPTELELPAGEEVTIEITNEGSSAYNSTVDRLDPVDGHDHVGRRDDGDVHGVRRHDGVPLHLPDMTGTIVAT